MRYISVVTIASITLLLVLASYLIFKGKSRSGSFRWIGFFFLLLAMNLGDGLLFLEGFYSENPQLAGWEEAFVLLFGPSLLFFAYSTTDPPFRWSLRKAVHLIPFLVFELTIVGLYQSLSADEQQAIIANASLFDPPAYVIFLQLAALLHFVSYTLYARHIIVLHEEKLKQDYSTRMVTWAKSIYNYLIFLFSLSLAATLLQQFGNPEYYLFAVLIVVVSTTIILFLVLIRALNEPILLPASRKSTEHKLSADDVGRLSAKIQDYFITQSGYSNPDLTIKDLSEQLAEPTRDVSHVVNHHLAKNFYDLVNSYRVSAAKSIFATNSESALTITDVMYQVGFNSKSSFNTQFKQKTGLTPSEYRKKARSGP
jgi:AraC-like DNA-binding protein